MSSDLLSQGKLATILPENIPTPPPPPSPPVYTTFTSREKLLLTVLLGLMTITSPLTATIYFPLLPLLEHHYHVSAQAINYTITIYIIFQALSPAIFAPLSDFFGRRIIYLLTLTLYALSNLGLALQRNSYAALLVLRALQSLGASAAFAVSYGVVADVCVPAERGRMVGPVSMALNLGTCIGPVVGGWIAFKSGGYDWVFWFLFVVGACLMLAVGGFLPETARAVVGNGSVEARAWWEKPWGVLLWTWSRATLLGKNRREKNAENKKKPMPDIGGVKPPAVNSYTSTVRIRQTLNPFSSLRIIFYKDAAAILWIHGSYYMIDYSIQTSIPTSYKNIYHLNDLQLGLCYLARGIGIIIGGYATGALMDRNYRLTALQTGHHHHHHPTDSRNITDDFPIERARTRGAYFPLTLLPALLLGYGWSLHHEAPLPLPLLCQFALGFLGTAIYIASGTLLVDVFPATPAAAAAAASIVRCILAALGVAGADPLARRLGYGWYFSVLGLGVGVLGAVATGTVRARGMGWRVERMRGRDGDGEKEGEGEGGDGGGG